MQDLMPPVNTPDKLFHDGDPTQGIEGTIVDAEFMNNHQGATQNIQQELINVLAAAAMQPDPAKQNQLVTAIQQILGDGISDGALLKENNLSDIIDPVKARENLELKTAAQKDVVTSKTDATADKVLTTGWMSLGGYGTDNLLAAADAKKSLRNGFYGVSTEPTYGNAGLISFGYDSGSQVHLIAKQGGQAPLLGICGSNPQGEFGNWGKIYTEFQKPTASDTGSVDKNGDTMGGKLTMNVDSEAIRLKPKTAGSASYIISVDSSNANSWYIGAGSANNADTAFNNYKAGNNSVILKADGTVSINVANGKNVNINSQVVPSNYANFDARYQAKGNYTPAGQAYTKAESDARYNLKNTATKAANAMTSKDASTGVMEVVMSNITVAANTNVSVTFSTAFPSVCVGVVIAYDGTGHGNDSDSSIAVASYSRTGCVLRANNASGKFMLIAKGY